MADIELRSLQQILGSMASRLRAETDANDLTRGSILLTILEAAASSDFQMEAKLIQLANLRNIDKASGIDLENLALEMGVTPGRIGASPARVSLTIKESSFTKVASNIYAGSNAPVAGDTSIRIVNGASFSPSGIMYLGRGSRTSEVVNYVSVVNSGSYWTVTLAAPLEKDHLVGEEVVMAQGGNRSIPAGTTAVAQGVGLAPAVQFVTQVDVQLPDGEDKISGVAAVCSVPGSSGIVGKGKISTFVAAPWSTATVTNDDPSTGGRDAETDAEIRERVKDHVHNLSGATERAILRAVIGAIDDEENKRVVSAFMRKPTVADDPTILFIDDGTGFAPSFAGIGEEVIVTSATGDETFFQLQKWPLVKAQAASIGTEPFNLSGGESFYVEVDGLSEQYALDNSGFRTLGVVTAQEVAEAINAKFKSIEARAKDGQLFITPTADDVDWVRVGSPTSGSDANSALRFPVTKQYTLRLYKNDRLMEKNGSEAQVQSIPQSEWVGINLPAAATPTDTRETLQLKIDGIVSSMVYFSDSDFATYTSSDKVKNATTTDWATMINRTFIGVTAVVQDDGTFLVKSNKGRSSAASIEVYAGTLATKLFPANSSSVGKAPEYTVNRLLGQIELAEGLKAGDELKAGTVNTRGFALTDVQANYNLAATLGSAAELVVIADGIFTSVDVLQSNSISFTVPATGRLRITGLAGQFSNVKADDWAHLYNTPRKGILRVSSVATDGSWVNFFDPNGAIGTVALDGVNTNITFFRTEGLPQLVVLPIGAAITSAAVANSFNAQLLGATAEILDSGAIKLQTTRYAGTGALAIPSITGTARNIGLLVGNYESNDPHVASIESADLTGTASQRLTIQTPDNVAPYDNVVVDGTPLDEANSNRPFMAYIGSTSRFIRQPKELLSSNEMVLRDDVPTPTVGLGKDMRATTVSGLEFGQADNMVFIADNDPAKKTFEIPMYVEATIAGPSVPSTLEFDAKDATSALLGSSARWLGHKFEDYRAWFQASIKMPFTAPNSQLRMISNTFGPNGERIKVGYVYPTRPNQPAAASFDVDPSNDEIAVSISLQSGAERPLLLQPSRRIDIEGSAGTQKITFLPPVDLTPVLPGDIAVVNDVNSANNGAIRVVSVSNLLNQGNAFEFVSESLNVDVVANTNIKINGLPSEVVRIGDKLTIGSTTRLVTSIVDADEFVVASPGFTSAPGVTATLQHQNVKASNIPSFTAQPGDRIAIGSIVLKITQVFSQTEYAVDTPFAFTGLQSGSLSRINIVGVQYDTVTAESFVSESAQSVRVFELTPASNTATALMGVINNTAGVKDLITAATAANSTGAGIISKSTLDEIGSGDGYVFLANGENYVYSTASASPALRLKSALPQTPEIGDKVRFVPMTPRNIADHFSKKQITGLTVAADVKLVDQGRRVQVSTKTPGGLGQVYAVGGRASGNNVLPVRLNVQEISADRAQVELDRSSIEYLAPGHTIKIYQPSRAKKKFPVSNPTSSDTVEIQAIDTGVGKLILSKPLVKLYAYTQTGTVKWAVRNIGRNRTRFEILSGTAAVPAGLKVDDWVLVGNGSAYAGITTDVKFASANQGWFQVRETDNSTYFDVEGKGFEEFVETTANSLVFASYHSALPGDQLVIGFTAPVSTANKGTFNITQVLSTTEIVYQNETFETQAQVVLGTGADSISILDQGYSTFRKVVMVSPKPSDPTGRSLLVVSPGYDLSVVSEGQSAKIALPNRLNFGTDPVPGTNGYSYWTGLKRRVQRIVDGYAADAESFPGTGATGVSIEVREPQIKRVAVSLKVKTSKGVSLQSLSDTIKSSVAGYVNSLGLGQDVILSEIVSLVQEVPGVESCILTFPLPASERITISDNSIARLSTSDISLS